MVLSTLEKSKVHSIHLQLSQFYQHDTRRALTQDSFKELFPEKEDGQPSVISFSDFVLFDLLASTTEDQLVTALKLFDTSSEGHLTRGRYSLS